MLKPLLLPQLVEERRQRETMFEDEMNEQTCDAQDNNSMTQSPITPTFSTRGHARYSSSVSSLDALPTPLVEIPSSPSFSGKLGGKTSLPDVEEEPVEREEHFEMFDDRYDVYDWSCDDTAYNQYEEGMGKSSVQLSAQPDVDYDLNDGFVNDSPAPFTMPTGRKRAHSDSPFANIADRLSTRFPGLSRKWSGRNDSSALSIITSHSESRGQSRAPSTRSSSLSNSVHQTLGISFTYSGESQQMPPTPARSEFAGLDSVRGSEDLLRGDQQLEHVEGRCSTPLLPPLMMGKSAAPSADEDLPLQSPLHSPSEPFENYSTISPLVTHSHTPTLLPSPPLSTKPSLSSMRPLYPLSHTAHPSQLLGPLSPGIEMPPTHLPPINLQPTNLPPTQVAPLTSHDTDKWSNLLGHANFTIHPSPYVPSTFDISACKALRAAWEEARAGFLRHLVRTGEHYGDGSEVYRLTREKWGDVDGVWLEGWEEVLRRTAEEMGRDVEGVREMLGDGDGGMGGDGGMMEIPRLGYGGCGGKFLELGDGEIVGPMRRGEGVGEGARSPRGAGRGRFKRFLAEMVDKVTPS